MANVVEEATQTQMKNIEKSTGKSFDEWLAIARKQGGKHGEIVKFLKEKYALGHGNANLIALKARENETEKPVANSDPTVAWFEGNRAGLRPIYDAVANAARALGYDVDFSPKKTYMSLRRKKQFACITPATSTRVDVGLNLKGIPPNKRIIIEKAGGMFSHKVSLSSAQEVDKELKGWLKKAYDEA